MAGLWGRRKREEQDAADADLARTAGAALVAADERIRTTADELTFAELELGTGPTAELREALDAVRTHLREAYQLNQLNHDEIPDTAEELRTRNARIVQLCEWADDLLDDRTERLAEPIARARRAPEILEQVRRDAVAARSRAPQAAETVGRLAARYTPEALRQVSANAEEVEQLAAFAEHSADISTRRRDAGQREQANVALEAAIEAARRASTLLDAVDTFEIEALRAETTLQAVIDDSRDDLVTARQAPQSPAVREAMTALDGALSSLPAASAKHDPFAELTRLREANTALDVAVDTARERAARPLPSESVVRHALDDADRQIAVARSIIAGHRGWIGADARTRLAEAERIRADLGSASSPVAEDDREQTLEGARRSGTLAAEALQLAQRDIDSSRPDDWGRGGGWGGGRGYGGGGGGNMIGGILGGIAIGSILDGMFDG